MSEQARWTRLIGEGVVIVLSILLAFMVDAWWDGRQDRALEQQYIVRLVSEIDGHSDAASPEVCDWEISEIEARSILGRLAAAPGVLEGASHVVEQWDRGANYLKDVASRSAEVSEFLSRSMAEH